MKQNARSLGKYLGRLCIHRVTGYSQIAGVDVSQREETVLLICLNSNVPLKDGLYIADPEETYPALKTYEYLIEPMMWDGEKILPIEFIYGFDPGLEFYIRETGEIASSYPTESEIRSRVYPDFYTFTGLIEAKDITEKLVELGFGAIKNKESSTGYVDLFGRECVKG